MSDPRGEGQTEAQYPRKTNVLAIFSLLVGAPASIPGWLGLYALAQEDAVVAALDSVPPLNQAFEWYGLLCLSVPVCLFAIVTGLVALYMVRRAPFRQKGYALAIVGIALGMLGLIGLRVLWVFFVRAQSYGWRL